ncbi:hypothetical protein MTP03_09230 [Tsukamurella sp. PLM1]|nr:hypothetical protein MTP03_09230 [Tsukamurella sp. PLM1]
MLKAELKKIKIMAFLIKHCGAIGVDREHGAESYHEAVAALESGEAVIVYPEATISRSFELKEFKSGAARMSIEAGVPIVPVIVWGTQRIWSKGTERRIGRHRFPVVVQVGSPLQPDGADPHALTDRLRSAMQDQLDRAQDGFPAPAGEAWVPARLGGGAPRPTRRTGSRKRSSPRAGPSARPRGTSRATGAADPASVVRPTCDW